MDNKHINKLFEATTPTEDIREKIFEEILIKSQSEMENEYEWKKTKGKIKRWMEMKRIIMNMKPVLRLAIFAIIILTVSVTTFAVNKLLSTKEIIDEFGDYYQEVTRLFEDEDTIINHSIVVGEYRFTVIGIASSDSLESFISLGDNRDKDRSFIVLATEKLNSEKGFVGNFQVFPFIKGIKPDGHYNPAMDNGYYTSSTIVDGVKYQVLECNSLEIFADRGIYLLFQKENPWENLDCLVFNEETGEISLKDDYEGFKALIELPLDKSKANPQKAEELLIKYDLNLNGARTLLENENTIPVFQSVYSKDYIFSLSVITSGKDIATDLSFPFDFQIKEEDKEKSFLLWSVSKRNHEVMGSDDVIRVIPYANGVGVLENIVQDEYITHNSIYGSTLYGIIPLDTFKEFAVKGATIVLYSGLSPYNNVALFDEETGEISLNPNYNGAKALFELQLEELITE